MSTNLKPADELLSVRQKIKELETREKELKEGFQSGALDPRGDFAFVAVSTRKQSRFDRKAAEAELGDLSRFCAASEATYVTVNELQPAHA